MTGLAPVRTVTLPVAVFVGTSAEAADLVRIASLVAGPWELKVADTAQAALLMLESSAADVLMVSTRGMAADVVAGLLAAVHRRWPDTERVVVGPDGTDSLAGQAEQSLAWPVDPGAFAGMMGRASSARGLLNHHTMAWFVDRVDTLPSAPGVWQALTTYLSGTRATALGAARIVERDVALSARVLRMANSPTSGLSRQLKRVVDAVVLVGLDTVRSLALSTAMVDMFGRRRIPGLSVDALADHGMACALTARRIAGMHPWADDAFTGALLQDIGQLVMADHLPEEVALLRQTSIELQVPLHDLEVLAWGFGHADVGGYLLRHWNLGETVIDAVIHHHDVDLAGTELGPRQAVALAHLVVQRAGGHTDALEPVGEDCLEEWAKRLGVADRLPEWIARASRRADRVR